MDTGFCIRYCVEKTPDKGLGIFSCEPIQPGAIVWRHRPGVIRVFDETSFRAKIATLTKAEVIFELTHVHAFEEFPGCLIRALDDGIYINHSDNPNLATKKTTKRTHVDATSYNANSSNYLQMVSDALQDDRYSLIATRAIDTGEELVNDYFQDDECPDYYDELYEKYGVREDFYET